MRPQWGIVAAGLSGKLGSVYHWVEDGRTACGLQLPEVYGVFKEVGVLPKNRIKCGPCVDAKKRKRWKRKQ